MKKYLLIFVLLINSILFSKDIFMKISIGNNKIGWYRSDIDTIDNMIKIKENSKMQLQVFENFVSIEGENLLIYSKNNKLIKFYSNIVSSQMNFYSNGFVQNDTLIIKTIFGNNNFIDTFDIKNKFIFFNVETFSEKLNSNNSYMYNPINRKLEKLYITFSSKKDTNIIEVQSQTINTKLFLNKNNEIIKSISQEGIIMTKTDSLEREFDKFNIIDYFLIQAQGDYKNIEKQKEAVYKLFSIDNDSLSNFRQQQKGNIITVYKKPLFIPDSLSKMDISYIKPNKEILEIAKKYKKKYKNDEKLLKEIMKWTNKRLNDKIVSGLLGIDEILKNGYGDCTEHAQIFASLANACGFNVDIVSGIVYSRGYFYYHAWNRVLKENKIYIIDATFNQFEADVSHIQLSEGFPPSQILIGKLEKQIKILKLK